MFFFTVFQSSSPSHLWIMCFNFSEDPPPQKKKGLFLGGRGGGGVMFFFEIKSSIFGVGWYKKFRRDESLERTLSATFRLVIGQYRPKTHIWNFENMAFLAILRYFSGLFFLNQSLVQNYPKMILNGAFELFWILKMVYIHFLMILDHLKFWLFELFSC